MDIFILFLLVVFFIFVVRPLYKLWRTYSKLKKGDFSVFGDIFGQPGSQKQTSAYVNQFRNFHILAAFLIQFQHLILKIATHVIDRITADNI